MSSVCNVMDAKGCLHFLWDKVSIYLSIYLVLIERYQNTQCTTVRAVLAAKGGYTHLTQYYAGGHNVMLDRCRLHDVQSRQNKDQLLKDISQGYKQNRYSCMS